jgi:hypothetical protein
VSFSLYITINLVKCGGGDILCNRTERIEGRNRKGSISINRRRLRRRVGQEEIKAMVKTAVRIGREKRRRKGKRG